MKFFVKNAQTAQFENFNDFRLLVNCNSLNSSERERWSQFTIHSDFPVLFFHLSSGCLHCIHGDLLCLCIQMQIVREYEREKIVLLFTIFWIFCMTTMLIATTRQWMKIRFKEDTVIRQAIMNGWISSYQTWVLCGAIKFYLLITDNIFTHELTWKEKKKKSKY